MFDVLDPVNKIDYKNGDKIQFCINQNLEYINTGIIVGKNSVGIIDYYIIKPDIPLDNYKYECFILMHTDIKKFGSNKSFLFELV